MLVHEVEEKVFHWEWKQYIRAGSLIKLSPLRYGGDEKFVICIPDHGKNNWILADVKTGEIQFLLVGTTDEELVAGLDKIQESGQYSYSLYQSVIHASEVF